MAISRQSNDIPKFLRMTNKKYDLVIGKQEKNYNIFIKMSSKFIGLFYEQH